MIQIGLQKFFIIGFSLIIVIWAIASFLSTGGKTADDTAMLAQVLENYPKEQVLGAKEENGKEKHTNNGVGNGNCPPGRPVIGWIDFRGRKLVKDKLSLPPGQKPSSCFTNMNEANQAGFVQEKDMKWFKTN